MTTFEKLVLRLLYLIASSVIYQAYPNQVCAAKELRDIGREIKGEQP